MSNRRREGFTGLGRRGKAPPPKSAEVKGGSGRAEKICSTVANAESYCLECRGAARCAGACNRWLQLPVGQLLFLMLAGGYYNEERNHFPRRGHCTGHTPG